MNKEKENEKQIFRKASLERLSNPEQLDSLLVIVSPKAWLLLVAFIILSAATLFWVFFGEIPIKIQGRGIVMNQKGFLFNVQTKVGGSVHKVYVKAGDDVKKGDLLAEMYDAEEELKLARARLKVDKLTENLARLKTEVGAEAKSERVAEESELEAKKYSIKQLEMKIESLEKLVDNRQKLYDEGLISRAVLRDTEEKLSNTKIEREVTRAAIDNLLFNLTKGYRTEEIKHREEDLYDAIREKELLEIRLPFYKIYSPTDSTVLALLAGQGDILMAGAPLIWMEEKTEDKSPYVIYGFFPIEKGKRVIEGTKVQISLSTVDTQEYGYMEGTVKEVSAFAVSKDSIAKLIHNKELVDYLTTGAIAVFQVLIDPKIDPTIDNYYWTSGKTPPVAISTGTVCTIQAIIKEIRPIYFILPSEQFQFVHQEQKKDPR